MRVFGILVLILLLAGGALFFFLKGDAPETASRQQTPPGETSKATPDDVKGAQEKEEQKPVQSAQKPEPGKEDKASAAGASTDVKTADTATAPASKPQIITKQDRPEETANTAVARMAPPSFDVVRVDANCGLLAAGTAEPTARVRIYSGDKVLGTVQASRRGEWVFLSGKPLEPGARKINAIATNPDGRDMETARLVIMQVPDCTQVEEKRAPAIALLAPKTEKAEEKQAFDKRVSKLLQIPEPEGDRKAAKNLSVGAIDYDEKGNVALAGKGTPGRDVRIYLENKPVGDAKIDEDGNWTLQPDKEIPAGNYTLRADQLDKAGKVISRIEIPFKREAADDVILAKGGLEIRAVVQPGNSLWRIARRMYGEGTQYTMIYQANQDQIKDPDLIFPGQIFKLPSESAQN